MTSSLSLLDLVNHLHKLESSVGEILIEAALKLSRLTDLNLFVIVESQEGRKFAGSGGLCDAYLSAALAPRGNDVRVGVDENETAFDQDSQLQQLQQQKRSTETTHNGFSSHDNSSGSRKPVSRKRHSADKDAGHSSTPKVRVLDAAEDVGAVCVDAEGDVDADVKPEVDCQVISDDEVEATFHSFIARQSHGNFALSNESVYRRVDHRSHGNFGVVASVTSNCNSSLPEVEEAGGGGDATGEDWRLGGNKMFINPLQPPIVLPESLCHKMRGLKSINNRNLFDKFSTEYRLFASTVYDFGKLIFHYAPPQKDIKDMTVLAFITECVEGFLKQHPFLVESEMNECKVNGLTITGFIRDRVKGGFKKLLRNSANAPAAAILYDDTLGH